MRFKEYDRSKRVPFIFGLCLIGYVGISFNIGNAVLYGLLAYTVIKMVVNKQKPVKKWWIMLIFVAIHIVLNLM